MARRWVKVWVQESLTGTLRFECDAAERGVWYDLLVLAGNCRQEGVIAAGEGVPYPDEWIAGTLNITLKLYKEAKAKFIKSGRLEENGAGLRVVNWQKYQSEYERQKKYRNKEDDPDRYTGGKYGHMVKK